MSSGVLSFQDIIFCLQKFWSQRGCVIIQSYDCMMGAGTFHPATTLRTLGVRPWCGAYLQPCRRPGDGRYGQNPSRFSRYYQFQVLLKPAPSCGQALYLDSLQALGIDTSSHDIRFVEDDWESPTLGASGLGWEVWCNGMEVSQFTYFQQMCGISCCVPSLELTYGLERIAIHTQDVDNGLDIVFDKSGITYGDIFLDGEKQFSAYDSLYANTANLLNHFDHHESESMFLTQKALPLPAYDHCIMASHVFNLLDARGVISTAQRQLYISRIRALAHACGQSYLKLP